jgi:hypothetical protein
MKGHIQIFAHLINDLIDSDDQLEINSILVEGTAEQSDRNRFDGCIKVLLDKMNKDHE